MEMNAETCQVLATVFPLVMVTLVIERRSIRMKVRKTKWFRNGSLLLLEVSIIGLGFAVVGTQMNGLDGLIAAFAWLIALMSVAGLATLMLLAMASTEADEDELETSSS